LEDRRIGISLLAFSPDRQTGLGTYTVGVTTALTARAPDRYTVFVPPRYESLWRQSLPPAVSFVLCGPDPGRRLLRVAFEQTALRRLALERGLHTIFFPHLFAPRWKVPRAVVTVYDLLLLSHPTDFPWYKRLYHRWAYRTVGERAAHIVTISEFCRRDIVRRLAVPAERVTVVSPGLDAEFAVEPPAATPGLDLPERYLLSVAGSYPHKRLQTVLDAFVCVCNEVPDLHLVVAGTYVGERDAVPALLAAAERQGVASRVRVLPKLPRTEMRRLFAGAAALVSASEFEGFGIPVIEAMAVGCPVAASPAEAVVEVLGGYGWVATDFSLTALVDAVRRALSARDHAGDMLSAAASRVHSHYTWTNSAAALEAVLGVIPAPSR
jgi:glycosyltransferase involved in cell wall biosynthesis